LRWPDLALAEDPGGHLVEEGLEQVVARLRDHRDVHVGALERFRAEQATETGTDHHHLVPTSACNFCHGSTMLLGGSPLTIGIVVSSLTPVARENW
jgi:hypothetical protein